MKNILSVLTISIFGWLGLTYPTYAQMGIGVATPNASAGLEVFANNKGLLIPRVSLVSNTNTLPITPAPAPGMLVYNTNAAMAGGQGIGFYVNDNYSNPAVPNWVAVKSSLSGAGEWLRQGNANINANNHFIGTTDNQPLVWVAGTAAGSPIRVALFNQNRKSYYLNGIVNNFLSSPDTMTIAVGQQALNGTINQNSYNRIAIGDGASAVNTELAIAKKSGQSVVVGNLAMSAYLRNEYATFIGSSAGKNALDGTYSTAIGAEALLKVVAGRNNALGAATAPKFMGNDSETGNSMHSNNLIMGAEAFNNTKEAVLSIIMGYRAGYSNGTAPAFETIVAVGAYAAQRVNAVVDGGQSHHSSVAVGIDAFKNAVVANQAVAVGAYAHGTNFGNKSNSVAIGYNAQLKSIGQNNIAVGAAAADELTTGTFNVALGTAALRGVTTGNNNTAVGFVAYPGGNYTNSTAIGSLRGVGANNQIRIGNASVTSIGGQVAFTALSDVRFKSDIQELTTGTTFISKLRPVTYRFDLKKQALLENTTLPLQMQPEPFAPAKNRRHTGLLAQQVLLAAQQAGLEADIVDNQSENGVLGIRYSLLVVPLVKTVQEQQAKLASIKNTIATLERLLSDLQ